MNKLPINLKREMHNSFLELENALTERNKKNRPSNSQETNIFRILKLENHEIRHGAFLDFLIDPKRNVILSKSFTRSLIENIVNELGLEDSAFNDVISGSDFDIHPIEGERQYSEVKLPNDKRIDHAFEVRVGRRKRAIIFEYKHNGVIQNDLSSYQSFVNDKYKSKLAETYFFILELGNKAHIDEKKGLFQFVNKDVLIDTIRATISEAVRCDMLTTKLYLQQYLEILNPKVEQNFKWKGLESYLWNIWNPTISKYEDAGDVWEELCDKTITNPKSRDELAEIYENDLFDEQVIKALNREGITTNRNRHWVRILTPRNPFPGIYFTTRLLEVEDKLYLDLSLSSYQLNRTSDEEAKEQQLNLFSIIGQSAPFYFIKDFINKNARELWLSNEGDVIFEKGRRPNSNRVFDTEIKLLFEVTVSELYLICVDKKATEVFQLFITSILQIYKVANQNSLLEEKPLGLGLV